MSISPLNEDGIEKSITSYEKMVTKPNLKGDWFNFFLLILLYVMQGMPIGLSVALPMYYQSKKVWSYDDQALFSVVIWPYTIKLLWAPLVDAIYIQKIGRRKSWLIPVQYLMGFFLLLTAHNADDWLPESGKPNLKMLVCVMFIINVLSATQDIIVDGWALTMLKINNVSYSSTCNCVGMTIGMLIGVVCPILLTSKEFCDKYLWFFHGTGGLITIKSFLFYWALLFLMTTTLVGLFKKEKDNRLEHDYKKVNTLKMYKLLLDLMKLPHIRLLMLAILTSRIGFCATDGVANFKLIDAGVSKDSISIITTAMNVVSVIIALFVSKYSTSSKPMSVYLQLTPIRLLWNLAYAAFIYYAPMFIKNNEMPRNFFLILVFIFIVREALFYVMNVTLFAFFARISDPRFGGMYMTLLNTVTSIGWHIPNTLALNLVELLSFNKCSNDAQNMCFTQDSKNMCSNNGGSCELFVDGYYVVVILCLVVGFVWFGIFRSVLKKFELKSPSFWLINLDQLSNTSVTVSSDSVRLRHDD